MFFRRHPRYFEITDVLCCSRRHGDGASGYKDCFPIWLSSRRNLYDTAGGFRHSRERDRSLSSCVWGKHFTDFIEKHGFKESEEDPCLFLRINGTKKTFLVIYVDTGIIASSQQSFIDEFLAVLGAEFKIRSHPVERFVGISINRDRKKKKIHLSQPDYTAEVVEKYRMTNCFPKKIPADPGTRLETKEPAEAVLFPYREAVGSLLFLALVTRPDMAFAVGQVARLVESPNSYRYR